MTVLGRRRAGPQLGPSPTGRRLQGHSIVERAGRVSRVSRQKSRGACARAGRVAGFIDAGRRRRSLLDRGEAGMGTNRRLDDQSGTPPTPRARAYGSASPASSFEARELIRRCHSWSLTAARAGVLPPAFPTRDRASRGPRRAETRRTDQLALPKRLSPCCRCRDRAADWWRGRRRCSGSTGRAPPCSHILARRLAARSTPASASCAR